MVYPTLDHCAQDPPSLRVITTHVLSASATGSAVRTVHRESPTTACIPQLSSHPPPTTPGLPHRHSRTVQAKVPRHHAHVLMLQSMTVEDDLPRQRISAKPAVLARRKKRHYLGAQRLTHDTPLTHSQPWQSLGVWARTQARTTATLGVQYMLTKPTPA